MAWKKLAEIYMAPGDTPDTVQLKLVWDKFFTEEEVITMIRKWDWGLSADGVKR